MRFKLLRVSLLCLSFAGVLYAGTLREAFDQTFDLRMGGQLILSNVNGSVTVESWDRDEVRVEAEKVVKARSRTIAEEVMEEIRIEIEHDRDYLDIQTRIPKKRRGLWGDSFNVSVKYRLTVPKDLDLKVSTVNGPVDVYKVSGLIRVTSTNGHVHVYQARGTVDAKTTNGGIQAELIEFDRDEDMTFRTTNGGIKVYFPRDFSAYVDARTTNGSIKTDFPMQVRGRAKKNRLQGRVRRGGGRIALNTTNGSIRIMER